MEIKERYKNLASPNHPATILYLVDISGSMKAPMLDGKIRIDVAKDAIQNAYAQMIQRSLRQGKIYPRYRVGMIAYSTDLFDVYGDLGSIVTIDKLKDEGVPLITPQQGTDMAKAFRYANKLIREDIETWTQKWLDECPPPMVINLTDCEFGEETQDPVEFAKQLQEISVPDGNVLVENIFITDQIALPSENIKDWKGYRFNETTGDPYGDKLLAMSSPLPPSYAQFMSEQNGLKIREGTAMMFPGVSQEFIKMGFAVSTVSAGSPTKLAPLRQRFPDDKSEESTLERKQAEKIAKNKTERDSISSKAKHKTTKKTEIEPAQKAAKGKDKKVDKFESKKDKKIKISVAYPKLLSKRFASSFLLQVYLPNERPRVTGNIKSEFQKQKTNEHLRSSSLALGQRISIKLLSPAFDFPESVTKLIDSPVSKIAFLGMPKDNCEIGQHKILISISDSEKGQEIESFTINVQVVDFAFDHISRPLLSKLSAIVLAFGSFVMFFLTFLEQIDKTVGLTSGTAAGIFALGFYASFYNLYQRVRPNTL